MSMHTTEPEKPRFWARQFAAEATPRQRIFDALFGIVVLVACFVFDPFIFRNNFTGFLGGPGLLQDYAVLAYLGAALVVPALALQLALGRRLGAWNGPLAGVLLAGASGALAIAFVILPYSAVGILLYGLGLLGFLPFLTAFVLARSGIRAIRQAGEGMEDRWRLVTPILLGLVLAVGLSAAANWGANRLVATSVETILSGTQGEADAAVQDLRWAFWCSAGCYDEVLWEYIGEQDADRKAQLSRWYEALTGRDAQSAAWRLRN